MTDVLEDTTVLDELDFDDPCVAYLGCANPATWDWVCELCDIHGPTCEAHRRMVEEAIRIVVAAGGHLRCHGCGRNNEHDYHWKARKR